MTIRRLGQFAWLTLPLIGLIVWAVYFMAAYSFLAVACARGFAETAVFGARATIVVPLILAALACALTGAAWLTLVRRRAALAQNHERSFLIRAGRIVSILSLLAIAISAVPGLLLNC